MKVENPLGKQWSPVEIPENAKVIRMAEPELVKDVPQEIRQAFEKPIGSDSLDSIARAKKLANPGATAVIAVSDNTRPVPYTGADGILMPIIESLLHNGFQKNEILIIIATGTHRAMTGEEIDKMLDPKIRELGIEVVNHDCRDDSQLVFIGKTRRGTEVMIDKRYMASDLKIATGLIESHFMAGASGGRKAICPGLIGEKTTYIFHGAELMADPRATDLQIEGNPVHDESLEVARMAGVDFLVNVTLNHQFKITGIFCGDLEKAHLQGVEKIRESVLVKTRPADIVITHAGFVGINHYQCAKCAVASLGILKPDGYLIIMADTTDLKNKVGALKYKISLALLKVLGPDRFLKTICSPDWTFLPDQWQVQQWGKVFSRIPMDHLYLYSPKLDRSQWECIPGINGADLIGQNDKPGCFDEFVRAALAQIETREGKPISDFDVSYIAEGPYVVPRAE